MSELTPAPDAGADWIDHGSWLRVVPIVHGRAPFAAAVRQAFEARRPRVIAVELPPALADLVVAGVRRLPALSAVSYELPPRSGDEGTGRIYVPIDPADGIVEAIRLALEHDVAIEWIDRFVPDYEPPPANVPDPELAAAVGVAAYAERVLPHLRPHPEPRQREADRTREALMAWRVGALAEVGDVLLVVGMAHWPGIARALEAPGLPPEDDLVPLRAELGHLPHAHGILGELPGIAAIYEQWRRRQRAAGTRRHPRVARWDPRHALETLIAAAEREYTSLWGLEVPRPNRRALRRFAGKLAACEGAYLPDLHDLIVAAKSCHDDDLACALYDLATIWPHAHNRDGIPEVDLDPERILRHHRKIKVLRRDPEAFGRDRDPTPFFRRRPEEAEDEDWESTWNERMGCSYVPEDLRQLEWVAYVRQQAPHHLAEARTSLVEFKGCMLDGIDIRETMRNWWRRQIIVREERRVRGTIGPVCVIYDDEDIESDARFPNCIVWPGEKHDEGDLVLYSTQPGDRMIGPGIARCEYGGFLTLPGVHLAWWQDPFAIFAASGLARTKGEVLMLTAVHGAIGDHVVVIADRPPRAEILAHAARAGHPIIHITASSFTPSTLAKLRVFHVLAGTRVRAHARDYIEPRPHGFHA